MKKLLKELFEQYYKDIYIYLYRLTLMLLWQMT